MAPPKGIEGLPVVAASVKAEDAAWLGAAGDAAVAKSAKSSTGVNGWEIS